MKALKDEPPIKEGTPDLYVPKKDSMETPDVGVKENHADANQPGFYYEARSSPHRARCPSPPSSTDDQ